MATAKSTGHRARPQPGAAPAAASKGAATGSPHSDLPQFLESVVASVGSGIVAFDRDLRIVLWNAVVERLTGLPPERVLGRRPHEVFPHVPVGPLTDNLNRALEGQEPPAEEIEMVVPETGRRAWVLGSYRPHRDAGGQVIGVVASFQDVTEIRKAQDALERSETQFREIFDSISDGVTIAVNGRFVEVNKAAYERLGYTRDEMIGMATRDVSQPETAGMVVERIASILAGHHEVFQAGHVARDGSVWPTEVSARRIDFRGQAAVLAVVRDVSERKRAEAAVREQAAYLQQLVDAIPTPIIAKNADGTVRIANRAFKEAASPEAGGVVGKRTEDVGVQEAALHREHDQQILRDGTIHTYELNAFHPKGTRRIMMTKAPLRAADGTIEGIATAALDITDRHEAELALRQSEERFRTLFEHAADAIFILDTGGGILDINRAGEELTGRRREDLIGRNVAELGTAENAPAVPGWIARLVRGGSLSFETALQQANGTAVPLEMSASVIDLGGRPALLAIGRDITERKRAEAERRELEEQLQQVSKMEGIGQLAGGIAHDFNNLLTAIRGYASLALATVPEGSPAKDDIVQIEQAADRAAALTRQLLAFARRAVLRPEVLDLSECVRKIEPMLERLLGEDVALVVETGTPKGRVLADPNQIEQIVINLAVNARDAMPEGGKIVVEVGDVTLDEEFARQHRSATVGPNVMLAVSDSGTGMSEETKAHLFEPFFTTKGPGKGTGLGLATVYGVVRQSGGCVLAESELGRGSTFRVFLPCVQADQAQDQDMPLDVPAPAPERRGARILVVEDDAGVRGFTSRVLELAGYDVLSANTPAHALEQNPADFDLLLTDVVMPMMNGREVANRLLAKRPDLRVLFMSGHADETIVRHGVLDTKIRYLPKPFTAPGLVAAVDAALGSEPKTPD